MVNWNDYLYQLSSQGRDKGKIDFQELKQISDAYTLNMTKILENIGRLLQEDTNKPGDQTVNEQTSIEKIKSI